MTSRVFFNLATALICAVAFALIITKGVADTLDWMGIIGFGTMMVVCGFEAFKLARR